MKFRKLTWFGIPVLLCAMLSNGCKRDEPPVEPASTATFTAASSLEAGAVADIANDVSRDVGKVISATNGGAHRVIVFEETHLSRVGQVELAVMFLRLREKYGLRHLSLEGATSNEGALRTKWFHDLKEGDAKEDVALRLLREGEINACEFIAMVQPDVQVVGNESADEYAVQLDDAGASASTLYLIAIAQQSMSPDQIRTANALVNQHKQQEALSQIMESSDWTKERYQKLTDKYGTVSSEDMVVLLHEIDAKASEVGAKIDDGTRAGMASAIAFFETAGNRSKTMAKNTASMFSDGGVDLVALDIGAAHTSEITRLLKESGASFAVIRPASLAAHDEHGELAFGAYERKVKGDSVDARGLGAYLNGRDQHKPPPVVDKPWLQNKAEIYYATHIIITAAAGGEQPPFATIAPQLALLKWIVIDPESYQIIEVNGRKRVIFKMTVRLDANDPSKTMDVWAGGWKEPPGPPKTPRAGVSADDSTGPNRKTLEAFLLKAREELMKEEKPKERGEDGGSEKEGDSVLLPISEDMKATFAKSEEAVRRVATSG